MSQLGDRGLRLALSQGWLEVDPLPAASSIQPASIDLRLDRIFLTHLSMERTHHLIDPRVEQEMDRHEVEEGEPFMLRPGAFALGSTVERIKVGPTLAARIEGKSSIGRLGIEVHSTAGFIDPGFDGVITLEIKNVAPRPVKLWPGMFIAQLAVIQLDRAVAVEYGDLRGSHYQGQRGPTPSKAHLQFAGVLG